MKNIGVEILMSFWNGDTYIVNQIESIINQSFPGNILITIRDDGSTNTNIKSLLKNITFPSNRQLRIIDGCNVGPQKSFLQLIQLAKEKDYYFFADQDDVWLPHKINSAIELMEKMNAKTKMYCSNFIITDALLEPINESGVQLRENSFHFLRTIMFNIFPGCVMGFDKNLLKVLKKLNLNDCMMHDSYALATALATGKVCYDPQSSIKHRIHQNNVVGYGLKKIDIRKWIPEKVKLLLDKESYDLAAYAKRLIDVIGKDNLYYYDDICILKDYKKSYKNTFKLLFHKDLKNPPDRCTFSIYSKIIFHLF